MLNYKFFMFFITFNISLLAMEQYSSYYPVTVIPNKPHYKKLKEKFGEQPLLTTLSCYQHGNYNDDGFFQKWSLVANNVIGYQYVEEERRYFLVNIMLHAQQNVDGLNILYDIFSNKNQSSSESFNTPQGTINIKLPLTHYKKAMEVCNDIRTTIFIKNNTNSLVLVERTSHEMTPEIKWSLFKGMAVISYLLSSCLTKQNQNEDKNKKKCTHSNDSLFSFLELSNTLQKMEEDTQKALHEQYPVLKKYVVRPLFDDKLSWIYDINNWIFYGSIGCMMLLLLCLFRGQLPNMYRTFTVWIIT